MSVSLLDCKYLCPAASSPVLGSWHRAKINKCLWGNAPNEWVNFFWWPQRNSDQLHLQVAPAEQAEERGKGIQEPTLLSQGWPERPWGRAWGWGGGDVNRSLPTAEGSFTLVAARRPYAAGFWGWSDGFHQSVGETAFRWLRPLALEVDCLEFKSRLWKPEQVT